MRPYKYAFWNLQNPNHSNPRPSKNSLKKESPKTIGVKYQWLWALGGSRIFLPFPASRWFTAAIMTCCALLVSCRCWLRCLGLVAWAGCSGTHPTTYWPFFNYDDFTIQQLRWEIADLAHSFFLLHPALAGYSWDLSAITMLIVDQGWPSRN